MLQKNGSIQPRRKFGKKGKIGGVAGSEEVEPRLLKRSEFHKWEWIWVLDELREGRRENGVNTRER